MRNKMVLAVAVSRCQSSAEYKSQSELELSASTNIMLLKNGALNFVPSVQNKIFKLNLLSFKLSRSLLSLASWSSSECSQSAKAPD